MFKIIDVSNEGEIVIEYDDEFLKVVEGSTGQKSTKAVDCFIKRAVKHFISLHEYDNVYDAFYDFRANFQFVPFDNEKKFIDALQNGSSEQLPLLKGMQFVIESPTHRFLSYKGHTISFREWKYYVS